VLAHRRPADGHALGEHPYGNGLVADRAQQLTPGVVAQCVEHLVGKR